MSANEQHTLYTQASQVIVISLYMCSLYTQASLAIVLGQRLLKTTTGCLVARGSASILKSPLYSDLYSEFYTQSQRRAIRQWCPRRGPYPQKSFIQ